KSSFCDQPLFSAQVGLQTRPAVKLVEVSGRRSGLPPVTTEICVLACSKFSGSGTPSSAQFAPIWPVAPLHGSWMVASKREKVPYSSPIDGARKPSAQVLRNVRSSLTCQRSPNLLLVVPPKFE